MVKKMPSINMKLLKFLLTVTIISILCPAMAFSQEEKKPVYPQVNAVITAKYKGIVPSSIEELPGHERGINIIASGKRYALIDTTSVVGMEGEPMTMNKLPVPCEAIIFYQPINKNNPNVIEIILKHVIAGATAAWTVEGPR